MSPAPGSPRGERPGRPGVTWETILGTTGEVLVPDDTADDDPPRPNRATRRRLAKDRRRRT